MSVEHALKYYVDFSRDRENEWIALYSLLQLLLL